MTRAITRAPSRAPQPTPLPDPTDHIAFKLGEISGQLRELIHAVAGMSTKIDAIGLRVAALEAEQNRRQGASGLIALILKSPALGWLAGAAVTVWAVLTGKGHS